MTDSAGIANVAGRRQSRGSRPACLRAAPKLAALTRGCDRVLRGHRRGLKQVSHARANRGDLWALAGPFSS